jgi:predicted SAM-dependent methyltransferase
MVKNILRKLFSRVPYVKEIYRIIGLGFKVQALERSIAYYDIRIDKIYKNVDKIMMENERILNENINIKKENERLSNIFPRGNEALWSENELTLNQAPSNEMLSEIFNNIDNLETVEYSKIHYFRWKNTFARLEREFPAKLNRVVELGAASFYNKKLLETIAADEYIYVGKPFMNGYSSFNGRFVDFNLEEASWPIESESVDVFLAFELIEHFYYDPMLFLYEANRCLKSGGKLIISTPNIASWKSLRALLTHYSPNFYVKFFPGLPLWQSHRTEYTLNDLKEFARSGGFSAKIETFNSYSTTDGSCIEDIFKQCNWDVENRGDTLWAVFEKNDAWV